MPEQEIESAVTGFHTLSTYRYVGFDDKILRDYERMLINLGKTKEWTTLKKFLSDLYTHLHNSSGAHKLDLTIDDNTRTVIESLYNAYRDAGYQGTITDMLTSIVKEIEVGTIGECLTGWNDKKAVTVEGWNAIFEKHQRSTTAHERLVTRILPDHFPTTSPDICISHLIRPRYISPLHLMVDTPNWRMDRGTIYFKFYYDVRDYRSYLPLEILLVSFNAGTQASLEIKLMIQKVHKGYDAKLLVKWTDRNEYLRLPLNTLGYGIGRYVLRYDNQYVILRDTVSTVTGVNPFHNKKIINFQIRVPLGEKAVIGLPYCAMSNFSHYNTALTSDEQVALLNQ